MLKRFPPTRNHSLVSQAAAMKRRAPTILIAALLVSVTPALGRSTRPGGPAASLVARNAAFLAAVDHGDRAAIAAFFARTGEVTYVHARHERDGNRVARWRFPAADVPRAIVQGPLTPSFAIQVEGQPVGLFVHQLMLRGARWRWVGGTRFVPPGGTASSPIFVEWRREGGQWVVSAFGDELFGSGPLPPWCC